MFLQETNELQDSVILFRFVPGKLMFYSPFKGNDKSITAAANLIERHREEITSGKAWIFIQGFCGSYGSQKENLRAAKNRTNQVKSWFITHYGMKEEYYRTRNSSQSYQGIRDVVALMGIRYAEGYDPLAKERALQARRDSLERLRADSLAALELARQEQIRLDSLRLAEELRRQRIADSLASAQATPELVYVSTPWYIKSNLIYDVLLMPSLEIEYRFNDRWSAAVEGNIAWWHNDGKHKYYQLATIIPEARYWFKPQGSRRGHYVGLFGGGGWYDLENGSTGYRGTGGMVGASYGYMFPIGKYFAFEAGIGVGFMTTKYEEYLPQDGHYVYQQTNRTNYVGPLKLKFAFVWNIGRWTEKGGNK
ncbi:DUF3575 domain-containing protein [Phocaeicola plebeius]|uniref:DUF3575 domain-containing protein n=1 Tax=Phocaeicola plebeius TaxID=310297 RepID=UPI0025A4CB68|nr:DUF3575 domain-containing protein [Phocaeicola plebeius]MCR8883066.1 DUF3575 domain-containing protein [Phocaeicola plebeius]MDM8285517.1 DUF3575 domain-containing protein [Phocaeicola plebeius]